MPETSVSSKSILMSKTFYATVLTMIAMFFPHLFTNLGLSGDTAAMADKMTAAVGFLGIIWGRYKAGGIHFFFN